MPERFIDDRTLIYEFRDEILVFCPRCGKCARLIYLDYIRQGEEEGIVRHPHLKRRRLVCATCYFDDTTDYMALFEASGRDLVQGYPLWLSATCAGGQLWAYNFRHLAWLERYVRATLRERRRDPEWGWCNWSAANRLPAWIMSAKNRADILRGIAKIRRNRAR